MLKNLRKKLPKLNFGRKNKKQTFTVIYLLVGAAILCCAYQLLVKNNGNTSKQYNLIEGLDNKKTLVYFHMNGCGHCKSFMPEWDSFQKSYKGPIGTKKVEQSQDKALVSKLKISGFPTVMLLDGQNQKIDEFNGERTKKALTEFCKKHA